MRKFSHAVQKSFQSTGNRSNTFDRTGAAPALDCKPGIRGDERLGPDTSEWEIKDFLTFRINVLYRLLDRQLKKMLAEHHDLSIAEWRVLGQLATNSPTTVRGRSSTHPRSRRRPHRQPASSAEGSAVAGVRA